MALPAHKRPGQPLRAAEVNALRAATRAATELAAAGDIGVVSDPSGMAVYLEPSPEIRPFCVKAEYTTANIAPRYGVVEFFDAIEGYEGPILTQCRQPSQCGLAPVGVLISGAAETDVVWVQFAGFTPILFESAYHAVVAGDRLGSRKGGDYAQYNRLGPFRVCGVYGAVSGTIHAAVVEITGLRGDYKIVDADAVDPSLSGPYQNIIWCGFSVSQTSPGALSVDL